jgi:hypothetical protein
MNNLNSKSNNTIETKEVSINLIMVKDVIQQREELNNDCVVDYIEEISNGVNFPPLVVYDDGESLLLADGRHRYEAYLKAGVETVLVDIYKGSERDAILHAVGANANHGLRRTNADKRKAVITLLTDSEWGQWSDTAIAKRCCVCQPLVGKVRRELTNNGYEWGSKRIGADGREIDTSNIGVKSKSDQSEDTPTEEDETQASEQDEPADLSDSEPEDKAGENNDTSVEEGNSESDGNEANEADESTSVDSEVEEPTPDENQDKQESKEEDGLEETKDGDLASKEETENAGNIESSPESELGDSQIQSIETPDTVDIQTLKAEIVELKKTIIEKDHRIAELEQEVANLKDTVKFYEEETVASM